MPLDLTELVAPAHTALVLQEVQNGVVGQQSALPALAAAGAAVGLIGHCAELARAARARGVPVIHCTAETRPDGLGANRNARLFLGVKKSPVPLTPGTPAVEPCPEIGVDDRDLVLARYHGLGPMTGTQLDSILRNQGVTTIVGVGVSLNVGMPNFAFDAVNRGYQFVVPTDAVAGFPAEYGAAVLEHTLSLVATLTTTGAVVDAWATPVRAGGGGQP
ncbi:MAG TPA: cysteine hydrolase [Acidimicrobiia bacterium]